MFSNQEQLTRRTPKNGVDRKQFINLLVEEFLNTNSLDAKRQVLANLANFAYDPINYEHLRESGALDVFLHQLTQQTPESPDLTHYACSGICNLCLDPVNADHIFKYDIATHLIALLSSDFDEIRINAITTLTFVSNRIPRETVTKPELIQLLLDIEDNCEDRRLKNIVTLFLEDVCGKDIVNKYKETVAAIPLPL